MNRKLSFSGKNPTLYLVATPIGNLADMTYRAIDILKTVDVIYAEDTRNSRVLLDYYKIETKLECYHDFSTEDKALEIMELFKDGKSVALISDAGLPVVSDPGYKLVKLAIEKNIVVTTIPGPSAFISGLIASGLPPYPFQFFGFLDSKKSARLKALDSLKYFKGTLVFYEAPHRINETLSDMLEVLGDRDACVARELTKMYEEFIRGKISELKDLAYKGEIVIIVSGYNDTDLSLDVDYIKLILEHISLGYKPKEAIKEVSQMYNMDSKKLYSMFVEYKNNEAK